MKRLALFLDGTWNDPADDTNVFQLSEWVTQGAVPGPNGPVEQRAAYFKGVGVNWGQKLLGGAVGAGLSENVRKAYAWLVANYDDGDEIYIFGFSRGAYTARSVAGVIINCGLLRRGNGPTANPLSAEHLYERYQRGKDELPLYKIEFECQKPNAQVTAADRQLLACSHRVDIKMIGVWDTVGALGVPWTEAPLIGRRNFYFHNTNLSVLIAHAYHALAIDENRGPYKPTMWTKFAPSTPDPKAIAPSRETKVEQRWFAGAHSNVGGGYKNDPMRQVPLAWLQSKAEAVGLVFSKHVTLTGDEHLADAVDAFKKFMFGFYRFLRFGKRFYRPIGAGRREVKGGYSEPINEWIDASVFKRYQARAEYRPDNLIAWANAKSIDPGRQIDSIRC